MVKGETGMLSLDVRTSVDKGVSAFLFVKIYFLFSLFSFFFIFFLYLHFISECTSCLFLCITSVSIEEGDVPEE